MANIHWRELFVPSGSPVEIVVRGTIVYLSLFIALRFLPRRTIGGLGSADVLVIVIIADAVQQAMAGGYQSVTEGLLLAGTILGWAVLIDFLDSKFPHWRISGREPLRVISDGRLLRRNMERQNITEEEVLEQLRLHGLASVERVGAAYVESDGRFSVILREGDRHDEPEHKPGVNP
jgi:uncharacterized membrane protein YcaP (DUF421 family)